MTGPFIARLVAFSRVVSAAFLYLIVFTGFWLPEIMENSDYVSAFHVAGRLAANGSIEDLYPVEGAASFAGQPFDQAAHDLLPNLRPQVTALFMYSPLVAWIFAPLSLLSPSVGLFLWQMLSVAGLIASCYLLQPTGQRLLDTCTLSLLYLPLFVSILIGQVTILFGLVPLSAGYWLVRRERLWAGGLVWSLLVFKPPFLFVAAFVALALAMAQRFRCLVGLALGSCVLVALNFVVAPLAVSGGWLRALGLADQVVSTDLYTIPTHLVSSLPLNLLLLVPVTAREFYKTPVYAGAVCLALVSLRYCWRLATARLDHQDRLSMTLATGLVLLPLISPHTLYYDLALLLPAGVILLARENGESRYPQVVRRWTVLACVGTTVYLVVVLGRILNGYVEPSLALLLLLQMLLVVLWVVLLRHASQMSHLRAGLAPLVQEGDVS